MTQNAARRGGMWIKWLVSLVVIVVVWRYGIYGV